MTYWRCQWKGEELILPPQLPCHVRVPMLIKNIPIIVFLNHCHLKDHWNPWVRFETFSSVFIQFFFFYLKQFFSDLRRRSFIYKMNNCFMLYIKKRKKWTSEREVKHNRSYSLVSIATAVEEERELYIREEKVDGGMSIKKILIGTQS